MTDLYLIAHKVRGELAFDVACRIECSVCNAMGCHECDQLGYWWIVPTSGHRAYPFWNIPLGALWHDDGNTCLVRTVDIPAATAHLLNALADHYITREAPQINLIEALGLNKAKPQPPVLRRI